jgi:hypothetical protein
LICLYCSGGEASVAKAKNKGLKEFLYCLWLMVTRIEMAKKMMKTVKNHKIWHKNCLVCLLIFGFLFFILIHNIALVSLCFVFFFMNQFFYLILRCCCVFYWFVLLTYLTLSFIYIFIYHVIVIFFMYPIMYLVCL